MSSEDSTLRIALCEGAVGQWLVEKRFSLADLADSQGVTLARLLELYDGRDALLSGYYDTRWIAFHTLRAQVPGYDDYTFEEKLGNLLYSLIDLMRPQKSFVCRTWPRYLGYLPDPGGLAASSGNRCISRGSAFRSAFHKELGTLLSSGDVSTSSRAVMRLTPAMDLIWLAFLGIVDYWCRDNSHDGEKTMALIDKWVALLGAAASSGIADKGLDLARFLSGDLVKRVRSRHGRCGCRCEGGCCGGARCECRCEGGCCGGSAQTGVHLP
jgi:hypothetical protein